MHDQAAAVPVVELLDREGTVLAHYEPPPAGGITGPLELGPVHRIRYVLEPSRPDHEATTSS